MTDLPDLWKNYARLQAELLHGHRVNLQSWGTEGALDQILNGIQDNHPLSEEATARTIASAHRRERHRAHLRLVNPPVMDQVPSLEDAVSARQELNTIRGVVAEIDWAILSALAVGCDYNEVGTLFGRTAGSMRVRVLRLRTKLAKAA